MTMARQGVAVMRMVVAVGAVIVIGMHRPQFAPKAGANRGRAINSAAAPRRPKGGKILEGRD
jgi:hypothetical protein